MLPGIRAHFYAPHLGVKGISWSSTLFPGAHFQVSGYTVPMFTLEGRSGKLPTSLELLKILVFLP